MRPEHSTVTQASWVRFSAWRRNRAASRWDLLLFVSLHAITRTYQTTSTSASSGGNRFHKKAFNPGRVEHGKSFGSLVRTWQQGGAPARSSALNAGIPVFRANVGIAKPRQEWPIRCSFAANYFQAPFSLGLKRQYVMMRRHSVFVVID